MLIPPGLSQVRAPNPDTASLPNPFVSAHLIPFAIVAYKADVIRSDLSSEGEVRYGAGPDAINF